MKPDNDIYVLRKLQMEVAQLKRVSMSCSSGLMVENRTARMVVFINQMSEKLLKVINNDLTLALLEKGADDADRTL